MGGTAPHGAKVHETKVQKATDRGARKQAGGGTTSVPRRIASWATTGVGVLAMLVSMLTIIASNAGQASAGPPAAMFGFVPLPADDMQSAFESINTNADTTLDFTVGITVASQGAIVYYDHWEDGYEADVDTPVQATSEVWGDGDPLNGDASTVCTTCPGDLLTAGDVFVLRNDITVPRNPAEIRWDGRDKIASTRGFALTAGGWTMPLTSVLAGVVSAFDTSRYGTSFVVPVGEDTPFPVGSTPAFEYTGVTIMAANDNTTVQVDADDNGSFELSQTINTGETMFVNGGLNEGATISADKPVQVHVMAGDVGATYEAHFFTLFPNALLTNSYINPVGSSVSNQETIIYLYNPNGSGISVTPTCTGTGCGTPIAIAPHTSASFTMPLGRAARFDSGGPTFTAVGAAGSQSGAAGGVDPPNDASTTWDWGFTLVPANVLTTQVVLGWAPGDSADPPTNADYDPVWVTTFADTTLSIDFDADPTTGALSGDCVGQHDLEIPVLALESTRITDTGDNTMTGARVYTCDGVAVAAAWGEDPSTASTGAPGLDAGYTVIPTTTMLVNKSSSLAIDSNGDSKFGPGDTVEYSAMISNAGGIEFTNVVVDDALMSGLTYVADSTVLDDGVTITPIADDVVPPAGTLFPLDEGGLGIPNIPAGETVFVRFRVQLDNPWLQASTAIANTVNVTADEGSGSSTDLQALATADLSLTKTETNAPQYVGENAVFGVTVTNNAGDLATDVEVTDLLPAGLTYQSHTASQGSYVSGTGIWTVGDLAVSQSETLSITARVDTAGAIANFAEVTLSGAADPDSQPAEDPLGPGDAPNQDDEDSATVDVAPRADLSLNKVRTAGPDVSGSTTYRITVSSAGPSDATGIEVTELPPSGAVFASATPSQGAFDDLTGIWTVGTINNGASATLDITYTIDAGSFPATNTAELTAVNENDPDSTPDNNNPAEDDQAEVTLTLSADLSLTKTETNTPLYMGDNAIFEITVTNDGPDPANSVQVTDLLPAGLAHVSHTTASGTYVPGTGIWSLDPLASSDSATLIITARVTTPGTITNTAEITASGAPDPDSTPDNDNPGEDDQASTGITTTGGSLGDTVYFDVNGDGTQDAGDQGIPDVDVIVIDAGPNGTLGDGDDVTLPTVTTDSSGNWTIIDLGPGPYRVTINPSTLPAGLDDPTGDPDGIGSPHTADVALAGGQDLDTVDFAYTGTATVGDTLFLDFNTDGLPDPDEGIADVDVEITWAGFDDTLGTSDDVTYTTTSDSDGVWSIAGMPAGTVQVVIDLNTLPAGIDNYVDPDGGNDGISQLTIAAGTTDLNQDFGFLGSAFVGQTIWRDDNDNGLYEAGEGLAGVTVELQWSGPDGVFGTTDDHTYSTTTDGNGEYGFGNLPAGEYRVTVVQSTLPSGATNTVDPDGGNDNTAEFSLAAGTSDLLQNFAYLVPLDAPAPGSLPVTGATMLGQLVLGGSGLTFVGVGLMLGGNASFWRKLSQFSPLTRLART